MLMRFSPSRTSPIQEWSSGVTNPVRLKISLCGFPSTGGTTIFSQWTIVSQYRPQRPSSAGIRAPRPDRLRVRPSQLLLRISRGHFHVGLGDKKSFVSERFVKQMDKLTGLLMLQNSEQA